MKGKKVKNYILPPTSKICPEIIDYMFDNHNQYVGIAIKQGFNSKHIAHLTGHNEVDVLATWEQMIADEQLAETGFYYPDKLYSINPEMIND